MTCKGCIHYEACFVLDAIKTDAHGELSVAVSAECRTFRYANIVGAMELLDDLRRMSCEEARHDVP